MRISELLDTLIYSHNLKVSEALAPVKAKKRPKVKKSVKK